MIWKAIQMGGVKVIFLLRLLILAWLLSPDDFGLLAIATTAIGFMLQITDIGMIPALVQGKNVENKHYDVAWTVGVTRSLGVSTVILLIAPWIAQIFSEPRATPIIQALTFRPMLESLASIKVADLTRNLEFRPVAILKLAEALVNLVVSILLASAFGVWALVIGTLAGSAIYLLLSYIVAPHWPRLSFQWETIQPLIRFGRWVFLNGIIVMAGNYAFRVVISRQLGTADLGLYFLAAQLAFLPAEAATEVVGTVAFPLFARLQTDVQRAAKTFRTVFTGLSIILFPMCAMLIVLAPALVQYVLGEKWDGTGPVIQVLALVSMIGTFGEVTVPIFNGFGHPYRVTVVELVQSVLVMALVWRLTVQFGLAGAAFAWLPTAIISQMVSILLVRQILPRPLSGLGVPFLFILAATGACALVAFATGNLIPGLLGFVIAIALAALTFVIFLWVFDKRFDLGFVENVSQIFPQLSRLTWLRRGGFSH